MRAPHFRAIAQQVIGGCLQELDKPLRPLWLCPTSLIWVDQVAQPDSLPFTPLFLISASSASGCQRSSGAAGSSFVYVPGAGDDEEAWAAGLTPELFWPNYQVRHTPQRLVRLHFVGFASAIRQSQPA